MQYRSIVQLVEVYEDGDCIHLVTDLCTGGELFDRIVERVAPNRRDGGGCGRCAPCFAEEDATRVIHQVLSAVSYMHGLDIAHMDIKPEIILFEMTDGDSPMKIIDLGLSWRHRRTAERPVSDAVGSTYYRGEVRQVLQPVVGGRHRVHTPGWLPPLQRIEQRRGARHHAIGAVLPRPR